ncbi:S1C family serine protease [Streptomyces sp. NPDC058171]
MTESSRRDGGSPERDHGHDEQHGIPAGGTPDAAAPHTGARPVPHAHPTHPAWSTDPGPRQHGHPSHGGQHGGQPHLGQQPSYGAYPPPPPEPPDGPSGAAAETPAVAWGTSPVPEGAPAPTPAAGPRRRRARRPFALLATVAIVAAAVGGGTAYGIQELTTHQTTASAVAASPVASSSRGTVAGVAAAVTPSTVEIKASGTAGQSTGSGVIITSDGEVITNNHVVAGATAIQVTTSDGKKYAAELVGTDSKKDLALIKLKDASGLKAATLGNSDRVRVGQEVVAIGSPEGLTGTVTSGIVSALDRDVTVANNQDQPRQPGGDWPFEFGGREFNGDPGASTTTYKAIQTDASLNPGNSGGALIDMNGHIIGINSAMYSASSAGGGDAGSVGLGFAIPVNTVKADLPALRAGADG